MLVELIFHTKRTNEIDKKNVQTILFSGGNVLYNDHFVNEFQL